MLKHYHFLLKHLPGTIYVLKKSLTNLKEMGKFQLCSSNSHKAEIMTKTISLRKWSEDKPT